MKDFLTQDKVEGIGVEGTFLKHRHSALWVVVSLTFHCLLSGNL